MRGNLVAFRNHSFDDSRIRSSNVYRSLVKIVACHEKGRLESELLEYIQKLICKLIWSIIKCQGDSIGLNTIEDVLCIRYSTQHRSRIVDG